MEYIYDSLSSESVIDSSKVPCSEYKPTPLKKTYTLLSVNNLLKSRDFSQMRNALKECMGRDDWQDSKAAQQLSFIQLLQVRNKWSGKPWKNRKQLKKTWGEVLIVDTLKTDQFVLSLVDAYEAAVDKLSKTQIFSFLGDMFSLPELQRLLPQGSPNTPSSQTLRVQTTSNTGDSLQVGSCPYPRQIILLTLYQSQLNSRREVRNKDTKT